MKYHFLFVIDDLLMYMIFELMLDYMLLTYVRLLNLIFN